MATQRRPWAGLAGLALLAFAIPSYGYPPDRLAELYPTDAEPLASGEAVYGFILGHPPRLDAFFSVHVEGIASTDIVAVLVLDQPNPYVGLIFLSDGAGDLLRDSEQGDRIPEGSDVLIVDAWTGTPLLWGRFE
jgi:hypothetical protein